MHFDAVKKTLQLLEEARFNIKRALQIDIKIGLVKNSYGNHQESFNNKWRTWELKPNAKSLKQNQLIGSKSHERF